jgi:hypothetical protein
MPFFEATPRFTSEAATSSENAQCFLLTEHLENIGYWLFRNESWPVVHLVREQGAGGSNPLIPTIKIMALGSRLGPFLFPLRSPSGPRRIFLSSPRKVSFPPPRSPFRCQPATIASPPTVRGKRLPSSAARLPGLMAPVSPVLIRYRTSWCPTKLLRSVALLRCSTTRSHRASLFAPIRFPLTSVKGRVLVTARSIMEAHSLGLFRSHFGSSEPYYPYAGWSHLYCG